MTLFDLWMLAHIGADRREQESADPEHKAYFAEAREEIAFFAQIWNDLRQTKLEDICFYEIDTSPEHIDIEDHPDTEEF